MKIVKQETTSVVPANQFQDLGFDAKDNLDGVEPRLPQVQIVHQGQIFKLPDGSKKTELVGIIVDTNRTNALWEKPMGEGSAGSPPDCSSFDGLAPTCDKPKAASCLACPYNTYGSEITATGGKGRGKACKNMRRVHILMDGHEIPYRLTLSPANLRPWDEWAIMMADKRRPIPTVIVKLTLRETKNRDSISYSTINIDVERELDPGNEGDVKTLLRVRDMRNQMAQTMRKQAVSADEPF